MSSRIAVVGSGIAGLVAARELDRAGHEVTIVEAADRLGGHSNTVEVETEDGAVPVDTGFIVFNDRNYPGFERLLDELDVGTQPAPMSFSVSDQRGDFEWSMTPRGLFAKHSHLFDPRFHRMLADLVRFFREARGLVGANGSAGSLRSFLDERAYSRYFVERLIVPQAAAVWSADPAQMWSFPASFLAEFLDNHGALQLTGRPRWRSIRGGSQRYVEALRATFGGRVRLGRPVREVRRRPGFVELAWRDGREAFDEVVLAVHSDQALALLAEPTGAEREVLGAIPYQRNEVVLHTDRSLLPRRRRAWASWNFHLMDAPAGRTTVTYDMTRLQSLHTDRRFLVTLNRGEAVHPATVIRRMTYSHPVYTPSATAAQRRWAEISGVDGVHYCGAYWGWGFHEDGLASALRVSDSIAAARGSVPLRAAA
jgi:predicted NAD/FAD-binding protein